MINVKSKWNQNAVKLYADTPLLDMQKEDT